MFVFIFSIDRMIILHAGYEGGFLPCAEVVFNVNCSSGDLVQWGNEP